MSTQLITGFNLQSLQPIDTRIVASGSVARNAISYKYNGLKVFDTYDNKTYVYYDSAWISESISSPEGSFQINRSGTFCGFGVVDGATIAINNEGITASGSKNTFIGTDAGCSNNCCYNTFIGYASGPNNIDGKCNIFIGSLSGYSSTQSSNNTFIGHNSGYNSTDGCSNIFIGLNSGVCNTTGSDNTFIGFQSGCVNTTGNYNIAIGKDSGPYTTGITGSISIGIGAQAPQSQQLAIGSENYPISTITDATSTCVCSLGIYINGSRYWIHLYDYTP
jgi:hypothetical protein